MQQKDEHNCGIFVISAIKCLVQGKVVPEDLDLQEERRAWLGELLTFSGAESRSEAGQDLNNCNFSRTGPATPPSSDPGSRARRTSRDGTLEFAYARSIHATDGAPVAEIYLDNGVVQTRADIETDRQTLKKIKERERLKTNLTGYLTTLIELVDSCKSLEEDEFEDFTNLIKYAEGTIAGFDAITVNGQPKAHHVDNLRNRKEELRKALEPALRKKGQEAEEKKNVSIDSAATVQNLEERLQQARKAQEQAEKERDNAQRDFNSLDVEIRRLRESTVSSE